MKFVTEILSDFCDAYDCRELDNDIILITTDVDLSSDARGLILAAASYRSFGDCQVYYRTYGDFQ